MIKHILIASIVLTSVPATAAACTAPQSGHWGVIEVTPGSDSFPSREGIIVFASYVPASDGSDPTRSYLSDPLVITVLDPETSAAIEGTSVEVGEGADTFRHLFLWKPQDPNALVPGKLYSVGVSQPPGKGTGTLPASSSRIVRATNEMLLAEPPRARHTQLTTPLEAVSEREPKRCTVHVDAQSPEERCGGSGEAHTEERTYATVFRRTARLYTTIELPKFAHYYRISYRPEGQFELPKNAASGTVIPGNSAPTADVDIHWSAKAREYCVEYGLVPWSGGQEVTTRICSDARNVDLSVPADEARAAAESSRKQTCEPSQQRDSAVNGSGCNTTAASPASLWGFFAIVIGLVSRRVRRPKPAKS